jgi:hypothetical protein
MVDNDRMSLSNIKVENELAEYFYCSCCEKKLEHSKYGVECSSCKKKICDKCWVICLHCLSDLCQKCKKSMVNCMIL